MVDALCCTPYLCDSKSKFLCNSKGRGASDTAGGGGCLCAVLHWSVLPFRTKGDCLGNTTDCDLEDIPGSVSLSTAHISHVPSRRGAMALTLRHSCEYTQSQVSSSVFLEWMSATTGTLKKNLKLCTTTSREILLTIIALEEHSENSHVDE